METSSLSVIERIARRTVLAELYVGIPTVKVASSCAPTVSPSRVESLTVDRLSEGSGY